ncbi:molybdopterin molybdotransferase MoeA [uncultured Desulfuromonas sp.]|uniref:molybdopterin molybdotransferase MoeA n=1 Tax=uncultured Desulfuromonas sp. TaxID=181013 RepID=UPI002AABB2BB|nr:molybdopterin molybdotransferase MoeA [uncultured Desulfuromonas sp.]
MSPVSYPDALRSLLAAVSPVGKETVCIGDALHRITAETVLAPQPLPNSRRSAVDGYALVDVTRRQWRVTGSRAAGDLATEPLAEEDALAVMTGGGVPDNATAVVRVEESHQFGETLRLADGVVANGNINECGHELMPGSTLLDAGCRMDAIRHSTLCYAGVSDLCVYRPLRVGVMLSGGELLTPGAPPRLGSSYECHRALLQPILEQLGCQCTFVGPVADQPQQIHNTVEQLAQHHDLIVTSGGVSMGKYDFVRPLLQQQEFELVVDRTKIKPGSPLLAAKRGEQLFVAMPGYPAAFLVNLFLYLVPVIKRLAGWQHYATVWRDEVLDAPLRGRIGRSDLIRIEKRAEKVAPLADQLTSHYCGFARAEGLAWLDETRSHATAGETVAVCWFHSLVNDGGP